MKRALETLLQISLRKGANTVCHSVVRMTTFKVVRKKKKKGIIYRMGRKRKENCISDRNKGIIYTIQIKNRMGL